MAKYSKLKVGGVLGEAQFYKITDIYTEDGRELVKVDTDVQKGVVLSKKYVEKLLQSADQSSSVEEVTRTEMQAILMANPRTVMTVNFDKKVDPKDIKKQIHDLYPNKGGKIRSEAAFKKAVNAAIDIKGENRTMVGRHYGKVLDTGRLQFVDMEETKEKKGDYDPKIKQVDPRTLHWLIVNDVKYIIKNPKKK